MQPLLNFTGTLCKAHKSFDQCNTFTKFILFYTISSWGWAKIAQLVWWLTTGNSRERIPVGARFSAPVQTGPVSHPAFCTMGTRSFLRVKPPRHGTDHPPPSSAKVKETAELYLYSPSGPIWPVLGWTFTSSWDSIVGRVTIPWTEWSGVQIPAELKDLLFSRMAKLALDLPSLQFNGYRGLCPPRG